MAAILQNAAAAAYTSLQGEATGDDTADSSRSSA